MRIEGRVAPGFEAVREAFAASFARHGDVGAACSVYQRGRCVVDLWGGLADATAGRPWAEDTLVLVFSATKGWTALCVNRLVERGELALDAPIARYWPEFAANGKQAITLREALSHRAGLAAIDAELTLAQVLAWHPVAAAIAAQAPEWPPGSAHGYHARSFGWILGEVVRRATGRSLGTWLADEIAKPLGLELFIGLPASRLARTARLVPPEGGSDRVAALLGSTSLTARVMTGPSNLFHYDEMWNRPDVLAAEMPSSNGVGDARSLARLYAAAIGPVDGIRLLAPETVAAACVPHSDGPDKVILFPSRFGLGFALPPFLSPACGPRAFGHPGAGGSLGFADPDAELGFGYAMNAMRFAPEGDPRAAGLVEATYRCVG